MPGFDFSCGDYKHCSLSEARTVLFRPLVTLLTAAHRQEKRKSLGKISRYLLKRSFTDLNNGVVAFDWIERNSETAVEWVDVFVNLARNQGLGVVSLPHGIVHTQVS